MLISATAAARTWRVFSRTAHFTTLAGLGGAAIYRPGYGGSYQTEED